MNRKPLIIGQAPGMPSLSRGVQRDLPACSGRIGRRLARLSDLPYGDYLRYFDRMNLIEYWPGRRTADEKGDAWPAGEARARARRLVSDGDLEGRRVVLLGRSVARAFYPHWMKESMRPAWLQWLRWHECEIAVCPHPSGVNRWWNYKNNVKMAEWFWTDLATEALLCWRRS